MKSYIFWFALLSSLTPLLQPVLGFPLRNIGKVKNASGTREKSEPVLCWVVQIYSDSVCRDDGHRDTTCKMKQVSSQHYKDIAKELNLVIVHIFSEFPNHILMCYLEENVGRQILSLSSIHTFHPGFLRTENASAFLHHKDVIENNLSSHEEIVFYHPEHIHLRKSRVGIPSKALSQQIELNHQLSSLPIRKHRRKGEELKTSNRLLRQKKQRNSENAGEDLKKGLPLVKNNYDGISLIFKRWSLEFLRNTNTSCCCSFTSYLCNVFHFKSSVNSYHAAKMCHFLLNDSRTLRFNKLIERGWSTAGFSMEKNCSHISSQFIKCLFLYCLNPVNVCNDTNTSTKKCAVIDCYNPKCNEILRFENHLNSTIFSAILERKNLFLCKRLLRLFQSECLKHFTTCHSIFTRTCTCREKLKSVQTTDDIFSMKIKASTKGSESLTRRRKRNLSSSQSLLSSSSPLYKDRHKRLTSTTPLVSFNDPAFHSQWHLWNRATPSMDINVTGVWVRGYNGSGVTVAVVDDGLQWQNPDLKANYEYKGSWDFNDDDPDPSPSTQKTANHHGTRCAGEIAAAANNKKCGVGVAYGAKVSGLRVLDGVMTDSLEAEAFNKGMETNDIYSCSWGPDDDGKTVDGPHLMAAKAMRHGVEFGRRGFGSIFVLASGNGGIHKDNCNFDGYANSIYTVTIGAVDESGAMPYYAEECASMLGVTFSSGTINKRDIVTTDWTFHNPSGCTEKHTGTSAAAPLAAGMIALMLQARPCLTWRDVQYIIILTAKKVDIDIAHWQKNGAGLSHSHKHGFGLLSSWRMVNAARVWKSVPWMTSYAHTSDLSGDQLDIPKGGNKKISLVVWHEVKEEDITGYSLFTLESVQVTVWLSHPYRGKLSIKLSSPSKTVSVIAAPRPFDNSTAGFQDWTFTTVRCWGESPIGNWTLIVSDTDAFKYGKGRFTQWRLTLFGTPMSRSEFDERRRVVEAAMSGQYLDSNHTLPCPPTQKREMVVMMSEKTLKILILSGVFLVITAVYQTFEYLLCYNEEKEEHQREVEQAWRTSQLTERTLRSLEEEYSALPVTTDSERNSIVRGIRSNSNDLSSFIIRDNNFDQNHVSDDNNDFDDDEEDDVFDAQETRQLLSNDSKGSKIPRGIKHMIHTFTGNFLSRTFSSLQNHHQNRSPSNPSSSTTPHPEAIQLSTFNNGAVPTTTCSDGEYE